VYVTLSNKLGTQINTIITTALITSPVTPIKFFLVSHFVGDNIKELLGALQDFFIIQVIFTYRHDSL